MACGSEKAKLLFETTDELYRTTRKRFGILECAECGLLRLDPQPRPEELGTYYPSNYWHAETPGAVTALEQLYRRVVLRDHLRFLEKAIADAKPDAGRQALVMDVGCGGGLLLRMLRERGHRVLGLDFSLDAAAIAWGQNGVPAVCGSLTQAPLADGALTVLSMYHVLEHLYEPHAYLEKAYDLLAEEGRLVVQVPNAASWTALVFGERWNGYDVPRHLLNFRLEDLEVLLDRCGFEVVRVKHFSLRDNPAGFAISLAPALDPMARRVWNPNESPRERFWKNVAHLALIGLALPFSAVEALCRAGSTVMVEARKKRV